MAKLCETAVAKVCEIAHLVRDPTKFGQSGQTFTDVRHIWPRHWKHR